MMRAAGCVAARFIALDQGFRIDTPLMRCGDAAMLRSIRTNPATAGFVHSGRDAMRTFAQNRIEA
ncbi:MULTISPECIES: hypothetical protein [Burkholderia]|nr:hypothetical protein [Burkholderia contaminans]MBK1900181.1 hypothetical protein [Burkholderia contaminans]MBX3824570.1 hypothetical protein [Burkholderia contaminans]MCA8365372.1 hypothetical protein [Burkholderia contaminans]WFF88703.1 hypothetical protein P4E65_30640 [Burkholderia contaminans]